MARGGLLGAGRALVAAGTPAFPRLFECLTRLWALWVSRCNGSRFCGVHAPPPRPAARGRRRACDRAVGPLGNSGPCTCPCFGARNDALFWAVAKVGPESLACAPAAGRGGGAPRRHEEVFRGCQCTVRALETGAAPSRALPQAPETQFPTPGRSSSQNLRTTSRRPSRPCLAVGPSLHRRTPQRVVGDGAARSVRGRSGALPAQTTPAFPSDSERFRISGRIRRPEIRNRSKSLGSVAFVPSYVCSARATFQMAPPRWRWAGGASSPARQSTRSSLLRRSAAQTAAFRGKKAPVTMDANPVGWRGRSSGGHARGARFPASCPTTWSTSRPGGVGRRIPAPRRREAPPGCHQPTGAPTRFRWPKWNIISRLYPRPPIAERGPSTVQGPSPRSPHAFWQRGCGLLCEAPVPAGVSQCP